jgi:hypothetical protein
MPNREHHLSKPHTSCRETLEQRYTGEETPPKCHRKLTREENIRILMMNMASN